MKIAIPNDSFSGYELQTPVGEMIGQFPPTIKHNTFTPPTHNSPLSQQKIKPTKTPFKQHKQKIHYTSDDISHQTIKLAAEFADVITAVMVVIFATFSLCAVVNLFHTLYQAFVSADHFVLGFSYQQRVLSSFFYVLIATELLHSSMIHFDQNQHYASGMVIVAITAVARKIIILDYKHASFEKIACMSCIVASLGLVQFILIKIQTKR